MRGPAPAHPRVDLRARGVLPGLALLLPPAPAAFEEAPQLARRVQHASLRDAVLAQQPVNQQPRGGGIVPHGVAALEAGPGRQHVHGVLVLAQGLGEPAPVAIAVAVTTPVPLTDSHVNVNGLGGDIQAFLRSSQRTRNFPYPSARWTR